MCVCLSPQKENKIKQQQHQQWLEALSPLPLLSSSWLLSINHASGEPSARLQPLLCVIFYYYSCKFASLPVCVLGKLKKRGEKEGGQNKMLTAPLSGSGGGGDGDGDRGQQRDFLLGCLLVTLVLPVWACFHFNSAASDTVCVCVCHLHCIQ